jgi:hypothetical protein
MIAIGVEAEYRSVGRPLSRWGPKGEPNAPITAESEITDSLRSLKLIRQSDSSMITIGVESEYRYVGRSLSGWSPITAESEVTDFLRRICSCCYSSGLL